ncbi:hypothetical protein B0J13DRAFT_617889 [Dactylonectria estremocensis]|uniref:F-box domain-containing protein n=1 Tax=Dactylonectria estremocensis TaxID=1079267 RepID=A0A9P9JET0_9HYPO|nr:hypothetical protein B0J13DRAFT_617889 [Dactylonectria estremocensis]
MALRKLPMEILFFIIELLHIDYIFDFARTCRHFYTYILRNDTMARMVLSQYKHSPEATDAFDDDKAGVPYAFARGLRRLAKRRAAVRSAEPYSISVVARVDSFCFTNGVLCFAFGKETLHIRDINGPATRELVIEVPSLLQSEVIGESQLRVNFSLTPIHFSDGIVSCLYQTSSVNELVILSTMTLEVISVRRLPSLCGFVVRNDGDYLFYGLKTRAYFIGSHQWAFWRLNLHTREWTNEPLVLWDFPGAEVDKDVCFEILDGQFYCVSNNYSSRTQRVDRTVVNEWNSFYRLIRFPVSKANTDSFEEPPMRNLWRRNLDEGPSNRHWDRMQLKRDQSSGKLIITESRNEHLRKRKEAARKFSNNCYRKEVSFSPTWDTSLTRQPFLDAFRDQAQAVPPSSSESDDDGEICDGRLYTESRLPQDVHIGSTESPGIRKTRRSPWARIYHPSCETFVELARLGPEAYPDREYLSLRVRPKQALGSPQDGAPDAEFNIVWPRDEIIPSGPEADKLADMLWPDDRLKAIDVKVDDQSLVYAPLGDIDDGSRKHLVLISFDPAKARNGSKRKHRHIKATQAEGRDAALFPSWARMAEARDLARLDFGAQA